MSAIAKRQIWSEKAPDLVQALQRCGTAKEVARVADCSVHTASRYQRGETIPNALQIARLMGRWRVVTEAVLKLAGLDDVSLALEEARLRRELHELRLKRARRRNAQALAALGAAPNGLVAPRRVYR